MTFTKTRLGEEQPLKTKTKNMKNYIIALIATLIIVGGVMYHRDTVDARDKTISTLIEESTQPTELEKMLIQDNDSKTQRAENRKVIDKKKAEIDLLEQENKELRQKEYDRAKKVQEMTNLSFQ